MATRDVSIEHSKSTTQRHMKPTMMATKSPVTETTPAVAITSESMSIMKATSAGTIALREDQLPQAEAALRSLNFEAIPAAEITMLGHSAELQLSQTLDGFLTGIDRVKNPKLFALFGRLEEGVTDAKLPALLEEIQSGKIGWKDKLRGLINKKALAAAAHKAYIATCDLVAGSTNNLMGVMKGLEKELNQSLNELLGELQKFETLKGTYRGHIDDFAVAAAVTQVFLQQARTVVEAKREAQKLSPDTLGQSDLQEYEAKLQLLESRATALEGTFSRLPGDQLVIQQIQMAGVQTLGETATTSTSRFISIKTTLIALHGALQVKGVQQLNAKHANLDRQLAEVRGKIMKEVVTTAANAPGDNRLEQAKQLQNLIVLTSEIQLLVSLARETNLRKFEDARNMFASARDELANLSNQKSSEG